MKRELKPKIKEFLKSQNGEKFMDGLKSLVTDMKNQQWLDEIKNKPANERSVTDFFK